MYQRQVVRLFVSKEGVWSQAEQALHINILELKAPKFAILIFCKYKKDLAVHVQIDNQAALAYLVNMGITYLGNLLTIKEVYRKYKKYRNFV